VQDAATTFSGIIITIIPITGVVIASLDLFQTWNKNRKEEGRRPAIDFDGFVKTKGTIMMPFRPRLVEI
jgi:hypothetical protein